MDPTTSFNLNSEVKKSEDKKQQIETAGSIASNTPSCLFVPANDSASAAANNNSSSSGGNFNCNA